MAIVRLLRVASTVICLIVIASFVVFAADQTKTASGHQQEQVAAAGTGPATSKGVAAGAAKAGPSKEGSVHKAIDEASSGLTSPFSGLVSGASSEWATRGVKLLAALLVYGFGLGFLARTLRVRV
ncbi:MAG TPA: hypothetical protein VKG82_09260 [Solirubrobacteraceae bacterium]|nr:hypothetical protein [Solirubrobacteraceae bacterium]